MWEHFFFFKVWCWQCPSGLSQPYHSWGEEEAGEKLASLLCDSQSLYNGSAFQRGGWEIKKFIVFRVTDIAAFFFIL